MERASVPRPALDGPACAGRTVSVLSWPGLLLSLRRHSPGRGDAQTEAVLAGDTSWAEIRGTLQATEHGRKLAPERRAGRKLPRNALIRKLLNKLDLAEFASESPPLDRIGEWVNPWTTKPRSSPPAKSPLDLVRQAAAGHPRPRPRAPMPCKPRR